ncbi:hypothetical protein, unlikely [Trypanosoma brucei gambiense DAL972]|uniref:Uncharacterized protein n=1 Tax=Trypanosoma brucei gambiense (strain MHOM/CI/86/DAL972) TaxID=679716 RepID=D0A5V9_TRYB9|nr:hypothetical protein, unlikely [Trypanosoma brucei gambiense DAL972]CBH17060.1 hypothetical protein, unlikely [Trypanosoma brucei gambiense DAL972]|eukprot:XP_011779324.1 hypothetical protein, unlikely [Trypanosoma brucei gambiense DAL972]
MSPLYSCVVCLAPHFSGACAKGKVRCGLLLLAHLCYHCFKISYSCNGGLSYGSVVHMPFGCFLYFLQFCALQVLNSDDSVAPSVLGVTTFFFFFLSVWLSHKVDCKRC